MKHSLFTLFVGSLVFAIGFCQLQSWEYTRELRWAFEDCQCNQTHFSNGEVPTFKLGLDAFSYASAVVMISVGAVTMGFAVLLFARDVYRRCERRR
jgi:hypothetical protein